MISFAWGILLGIFGVLVAIDFRGLGVRVYDLICSLTPGGPPDPRFSLGLVRILWGALGIVGITLACVEIFK